MFRPQIPTGDLPLDSAGDFPVLSPLKKFLATPLWGPGCKRRVLKRSEPRKCKPPHFPNLGVQKSIILKAKLIGICKNIYVRSKQKMTDKDIVNRLYN